MARFQTAMLLLGCILSTGPGGVPANEQSKPATDSHGDPLPAGAIARFGTIRYRFPAANAIAYSPDSKTLAVCGSKAVHLVDMRTGKEIRRFEPQDYPFFVAFSPDGKTLAASSIAPPGGASLYLWEVAGGKQIFHSELDSSGSELMAFAPDGKTIVHGDGDTIVVRHSHTGAILRSIPASETSIDALTYAPDGKMLASANGKSIRLWNPETGREIRQLQLRESGLRALAFSPDGNMLAGLDGAVIRLWDPVRGKLVREFQEEGKEAEASGGAYSIAFGPDSKTLATGGYNVCLWNISTGKQISRLDVRGWHDRIAFAPDGKTVAGIRGDEAVHVWDLATRKEIDTSTSHKTSVDQLAFTPDGKMLASGNGQGELLVWDVVTRTVVHRHQDTRFQIVLTHDGQRFASVGKQLTVIHLFETRTAKESGKLEVKERDDGAARVSLSEDGRTLALVNSKQIVLKDAVSGKELGRFDADRGEPLPPVFAPNGKTLVCRALDTSGSSNRMVICLRAIPTGKVVHLLYNGEEKEAVNVSHSVAFADDGTTIAAAINKNIYVWETATGKEISHIKSSDRVITLSPMRKILASAGEAIHFWDVATGKPLEQGNIQQDSVCSLAFSPDGKTLATGCEDTTILLWDVRKIVQREPTLTPTDKDLSALWSALASRDAGDAYRAIATLAAAPGQAIPFLKKQFAAKTVVAPQRVARLIADLDSDSFAVRQKASSELEALEDRAKPGMRAALAGQLPSLEVRRRLESLLEKLSYFEFRELRAVQVLERAGTAEVREILETLAKGEEKSLVTEDARAALERLKRRSAGP